MTRITIKVSEKQKIKVLAAMSNLTLKDYILDRTIGSDPNQETIESFQDYENDQNLTFLSNLNELFKDLDS